MCLPTMSQQWPIVVVGASQSRPYFRGRLVEGGEPGRVALQPPAFLAVYIKPDEANKVISPDGSEQAGDLRRLVCAGSYTSFGNEYGLRSERPDIGKLLGEYRLESLQIGRASCRERVQIEALARSIKKKIEI